jgi:hypothetical protein
MTSALNWYDTDSWDPIPAAAIMGTYAGTFAVVYPAAADSDGLGAPCGAFGLPEINLAMPLLFGDGMAFWTAFFTSTPTAQAVTIKIEAFDPRSVTVKKWAGSLRWPTFGGVGVGSDSARTIYRDVRIRITGCAVTT